MKLADCQGRYKLNKPIVWTQELACRLKASEYKIVRVVDHCLDRIIGVLIIEFAIDTLVSYNEVERHFFKGLQGMYIKSLNTWTKILLCEKWVMRIN